MSLGRHSRWLFPVIMFIAVIALTLGLVFGLPNRAAPPQLADSTNGTSTNGPIANGTTTTGTIPNYNFFFFFGDSYTNTAFDPDGAQPSPSNPFGNAALSAIEEPLAGGPNWAENLTFTHTTKSTLAYDYAYNCGTVDNAIVESCGPGVRTIVKQVANFAETLKKGSEYETFYQQNSFLAFWIGINDAHITANNADIQDKDIDPIMEKVAIRYMEQLSTLYSYGVKNFLLLNVPPLVPFPLTNTTQAFDRTPQILETTQTNILRQRLAITSINNHISSSFQTWQSAHSGTKSMLIDTIPIFNEALDDPTKIGDKNSTCDVGRSGAAAGCVWWNDFHPAVNMHRWIAENVAEKAKGVWGEFFK
ncbi:cellulose-binding GDSL lipase/acylhydrolase [Venturia nashicola]|nr:cellulose-binding GDSL lipase/acylhydrolase [Venturia nashicola]